MTTIKVPRGSLKWQMNYVLNKQFEKGIGQDRHAHKKEHGHAHYDRIYSINSHKTYVSRIQNFGNWLRKEDIKHINQVTPDVVETFLSSLAGRDLSHPYIKSFQTAINHVFHGNDVEGHPIYSVHKLGIEGVKERKNNLYKTERPEIHPNYKKQFDLIKASGFRREEVENIGTKSMYQVRDKYYVVTNGKGGRPRYTKILDEYNERFKKHYSDFIIKKDSIDQIPQTKDEINEVYRSQKPVFDRKIPSKYATHIYRSRYAKAMLKEVKASGNYKTEGYEMDVNTFVADRGAFREVSRQLGHNRASVELLASYFRQF